MLFFLACSNPPPVEAPPPVAVAPAAQYAHYGALFTVDVAVPAATFLASPGDFTGKIVRVEGRVADVCQKAGCWMVIADGEKTIRVKMKDHGFAVAKDAAGCTASVEGTVAEIAVDPATVEHFASEATDPSAKLPEHAAKEGKVYEFTATSVATKRG